MEEGLDSVFEPEPWPLGVLTMIGNVLDRAVLRGMALAFESALLRPGVARSRLRAAVAPYVSASLERDPHQFFAFVDEEGGDGVHPHTESRRAFTGGTIVTCGFASHYAPFHRVVDAARCRENETIWVEHWMHAGRGPRPTIVLLHGFTMGSPALDAHVMMAERWFELGLDVALVTLPHHGRRASARCRYSGELFASWHVGQLNEAVRQSVHDVHLVTRWLARWRGGPVGILGVSLGGYIAALLAALRNDLAFVIPVVPAVRLADLPLRLLARSRGGFEAPFTFEELEHAYRSHSPLAHPLRTPRERLLIVGGRGDAVTPVSHAHSLWRHWGRPKAVWFSGGHIVAFRRSQVVNAIEAHFAALGLLDVEPAAAATAAAGLCAA